MPEVIEHGRTGFIVETVDEMVEAVRHIDEIDPAECRRAAVESRFGSEAFVAAHEEAYRQLVRQQRAVTERDLRRRRPGPAAIGV